MHRFTESDFETRLEPKRCALVIVDVQNDFCHERGAAAKLGQDVSQAEVVVPNIEAAIELARAAGVPRIYLQVTHNPWFDTPGWIVRGRGGGTLDVDSIPIIEEGTWGAELYRLAPKPDELVIVKRRYSGFAYTPLELALRANRVDTVVLVGTQTNVCVEATAVDALHKGYYPVVVEDCVFTGSEFLHRSALVDIQERVGPMVKLEDLRQKWGNLLGGQTGTEPSTPISTPGG